jgi:hypothetical protein
VKHDEYSAAVGVFQQPARAFFFLLQPIGVFSLLITCKKIRHPGENRGPEKPLILKNLDAGFRRHDDNAGLSGFLCSVFGG